MRSKGRERTEEKTITVIKIITRIIRIIEGNLHEIFIINQRDRMATNLRPQNYS